MPRDTNKKQRGMYVKIGRRYVRTKFEFGDTARAIVFLHFTGERLRKDDSDKRIIRKANKRAYLNSRKYTAWLTKQRLLGEK